MKKLIFVFGLTVLSFSSLLAQTEFGGKVGFNSMSLKVATGGASGSDSVSGYYVGFFC